MAGRGGRSGRADRDLLGRIAKREDSAFTKLYERYAPAALGIAIKICGDRELAEDIVQEAFLAIWQRPGSYTSDRGSVAAYIMGTVHHKAVDAIRREESIRRRERVAGEPGDTAEDTIEEEGWLRLVRDEVREAVEQLTPVQKEALDLAYFEGLTYSEVAEKLGIPLGTAKTRLRDGMMRLRDILADTGLGETL